MQYAFCIVLEDFGGMVFQVRCLDTYGHLRSLQWPSARSRLAEGAADAIATAEEQRPKATPAVRIQHLQAG